MLWDVSTGRLLREILANPFFRFVDLSWDRHVLRVWTRLMRATVKSVPACLCGQAHIDIALTQKTFFACAAGVNVFEDGHSLQTHPGEWPSVIDLVVVGRQVRQLITPNRDLLAQKIAVASRSGSNSTPTTTCYVAYITVGVICPAGSRLYPLIIS